MRLIPQWKAAPRGRCLGSRPEDPLVFRETMRAPQTYRWSAIKDTCPYGTAEQAAENNLVLSHGLDILVEP